MQVISVAGINHHLFRGRRSLRQAWPYLPGATLVVVGDADTEPLPTRTVAGASVVELRATALVHRLCGLVDAEIVGTAVPKRKLLLSEDLETVYMCLIL